MNCGTVFDYCIIYLFLIGKDESFSMFLYLSQQLTIKWKISNTSSINLKLAQNGINKSVSASPGQCSAVGAAPGVPHVHGNLFVHLELHFFTSLEDDYT